MILVIDNYDSFTYNLVQLIGTLVDGDEIRVVRNDVLTVAEVEGLQPDKLVISPGPGRPENAGITFELVRTFGGRIPILGVCLGHQTIGEAYGAMLGPARDLVHGKTSEIFHCGTGIYAGLPNPFTAARYHSLILERESIPDCFELTAWTVDGEVMGIRHRQKVVEGLQFHPESVMTVEGRIIISNFLYGPAPIGVGNHDSRME